MRLTLSYLIPALRSGRLPLLDYLAELEARFAQLEPQMQAFVPEPGRFERLRQEAQTLQATYIQPKFRPPLFGLPVGVKDIFHVAGFATRAGSQLPPEVLAGEEAAVVKVLRECGALILGKTQTTEFAYFAPGPTRNPRNLDHTPGGSSSGSAAAVAADLCPLALGTQTIGSVNRPAAFCGVVGYKPSYDRLPRAGVIPLAPSLDHVGLFATDVAGVEIVAGLLCDRWKAVEPARDPVLGVPTGPYLEQASPEGRAQFAETCARLRAAGLVMKTIPVFDDFAAIVRRHNYLLAAEAARVHHKWFAAHSDQYHPATAALLRQGGNVSDDQVQQAHVERRALRQALLDLMDEYVFDLWISPAAPGPAPAGLDSTGDPIMNLPWTQSGLPTISLPSGENGQGLPFGLQVTGRWYQDEVMLAWARRVLAPAVASRR